MARAFARAGRVAKSPVFLLTDEKVLQVVAGLGVSRRSSSRRGAPRPGLMARAFARAGRGADAPVFLLTDEKVHEVAAGLGISRRSSSSSGRAGRFADLLRGSDVLQPAFVVVQDIMGDLVG